MAYTEADFHAVRKMLHDSSGISLAASKQHLVYNRLIRRIRAIGADSFEAYLARVSEDGEERQAFINSLTTNVTSFYRERHHFDFLAEDAKRWTTAESVAVWSSACSTGEEAYSAAGTLVCAGLKDYSILGTDIDSDVLVEARRGVYPAASVNELQPEHLHAVFEKGVGRNAGRVRVRPSIRMKVEFERRNLYDPAPAQRFHYVFCRNVLIYFEKEKHRLIVGHLVSSLRPGGVLFLGHSESLPEGIGHAVEPLGRTMFRRLAHD